MPSSEIQRLRQPTIIEQICPLVTGVHSTRSEVKETVVEKPKAVKLAVVAGGLQGDWGIHAGKPSFYFIRSDVPYDPRECGKVTFEEMARTVLGENSLTLRADASMTAEELLKSAEDLKSKLEDPAAQQKIRSLYGQMMGLKKNLLGR